ncbi:hypothetical protein NBO_24g0001 [Nosema bombycis CQ1]|uniref:Uncharacterized protein n=1 Tax=Nosema bombycis (strain CQ1 / CVCC 102059) TaxID=578461 RepID=R0MJZ6_NOSB1|nr:hypothetical protein NBO_24g0001 [Nosema bombycis CQ1]|eukprot:EOB14555.1 hypothetical protein NBO_24g0001 [Nosema bombycis CQ1]
MQKILLVMTFIYYQKNQLLIFLYIYLKFSFALMKYFIFCMALVHYSCTVFSTEMNNAISPEYSECLFVKKYTYLGSENTNNVCEFCKKYDFCTLINTIEYFQERLEFYEMKKYAHITFVKLLNILNELLKKSEKVADLSTYSYVFIFLSNSIYLIDTFLNVYEENLHNDYKFRLEAIKRVSTNFEHVNRLFVVVQNLLYEKEKSSKFNFIRRGISCLKENNDVMLKIFNRCKTSHTIDYKNNHLMIIKQLTELQVQLKKIKNSISVTNEF